METGSLPQLIVAHGLAFRTGSDGMLSSASASVLAKFEGHNRTLTHFTTHDADES